MHTLKKFSKPPKSSLITSIGLAKALRVSVLGLAVDRLRE
jgi:hypothetical protein